MHSLRFKHPRAQTLGQFQTTYNDHFGRQDLQDETPSVSTDYEPPGILLRGERLTTYRDHFRSLSEPTTSDGSFEEELSDARAPRQFETTYGEHFGPQQLHSSLHRRPRSMISLVRESTSHQRSLRPHTPNKAKLHKTQSLTQPQATQQSAEDSENIPSTSGNPEPESIDCPEPETALERQQEDDSAPALICGDEQGEEATREQEACRRLRPAAQLRSGMLSLTINNKAVQVHCGLMKKCWSEMQMGSVNLPLYLTETSAEMSQAPTLTLPLSLLSALVPAPSPLPQSLQWRRSPSSTVVSEDGLDAPGAPLPGDRPGSPSLALDLSPKRRLAGLCLLLSFVFPSFCSHPIYLPPPCRRIPG